MTLVYADCVADSSTTTGTGSLTLAGSPPTGCQSFAVVGNGNTCYYRASTNDQAQVEVGLGTYSSTGPTLARTTVAYSTNSNNKVSFSAPVTIELVAAAAFFTAAQAADTTGAIQVDTRASVATTTIPAAINAIRTSGYAAAGDGGDALYKRVVSEPSHAGKVQSADGAWWEFVLEGGSAKPEQFGAIGDGSANDKAAINNSIVAISAISVTGGKLLLSRNYLIDGDGTGLDGIVLSSSNITIEATGNGATLKQSDTNSIMVAIDGRASPVDNIRITGVRLEGPTTRHVMTSAGDAKQHIHLLAVVNASNLDVTGNLFHAFQGDGVLLDGGFVFEGAPPLSTTRHNSNIKIVGNTFDGFDNNTRNGVSVSDGDNVIISENVFKNIASQYMPGSVDIEPNPYPYYIVRNISVTNNKFCDCNGTGHVNLFVTNNTWPTNGNPKNFIFSGNTFSGSGVGFASNVNVPDNMGIVISGNSYAGTSSPILFGYRGGDCVFNGLVITGNTFDFSNGDTPIIGFKSTYEDTIIDITLVGNLFKGSSIKAGLIMSGSVNGAILEGNTFDTALDYAVRFGSTDSTIIAKVIIANNMFTGISGGGYPIYCPKDNPNYASCWFKNNYIGTSELVPMEFVWMQFGNIDGYGIRAPLYGFHALGARCWNSAPAVGQPKSWVCTVSGVFGSTPTGTWVSEGVL